MKIRTKETSLGRLPGQILDDTFTVSPDSRSVAFAVADAKGKHQVVRDGVPGKPHFAVEPGLRRRPRGRRLAYAACEKSLLGSKRWMVILEGAEGGACAGIVPGSITFSPDGARLAYGAVKQDGTHLVVDGVEDPLAFDAIAGPTIQFSRNGRRIADAANRGRQWFAVVDGKPQGPYVTVAAFTFSPDSRRLAYGAHDGRQAFVVVDGEPQAEFDEVAFEETLVFSPDSRHVAYAGRRGITTLNVVSHAVVDGQLGPSYAGVGERFFTFGPVEGQVIHDIRRGERRAVVHGEKEGPLYDDFGEQLFAMSPDRKRFALLGVRGGAKVLIVDGREVASCEAVGPGTLRFSPDGQRLGYALQSGSSWCLVVDDKAGPAFDQIEDVRWSWSPDSQHHACAAQRGGQRFLVVDGEPGSAYDAFCGPGIEWDAPNRLRTLVQRGEELLRLEALLGA